MDKWPSHLETTDKSYNSPGESFIKFVNFLGSLCMQQKDSIPIFVDY